MIGSLAGVLTTCALIPQVVKVIKTKDTASLSLGMYVVQVIGICLWLIHGILIQDMALACANLFTLGLSSVVLCCKLKYH